MQIFAARRQNVFGVVTWYTEPIDVGNMPLFTVNLTVHSVSGTSTTLALDFETCDNLEDWKTIGSTINQDAAGTSIGSYVAQNEYYGRYVRAKFTTGGTDTLYNYSLVLNTFPSS